MKIKEEVCLDTLGKQRVYSFYTCDSCGKEYKKQKRFEGSTYEQFCSSFCGSVKANINNTYIECVCAHCGIIFLKLKSKLNSKSGLYFCCREHKDAGQKYIKEIQPPHYGTSTSKNTYRDRTLKCSEHRCEMCGYNKNIAALVVHHIDGNRDNNIQDNLIILCANCHAIEHWA